MDFIYGKLESQSNQNVQENNYNHVESILAFAKAYTSQVNVGLTSVIPNVDRKVLKNSKKIMMPLDGQQRLTTIWLLHYVLYHQANLSFPEWMKNFVYKTRKSSATFINSLIFNNELDRKTTYSESIKKSKWFYKAWLQDPTVKGMLVMLDEIQSQIDQKLTHVSDELRIEKIKIWINNLVPEDKDSAIQFSFLSLSDIDVEDDIYIKMNDRGKQLSDFEILKNDLLSYLQHHINNDSEEGITQSKYDQIALKIDKQWHDLFWNVKDANIFNVEHSIHYFILYHLLLYRINDNAYKESPSEFFTTLIGDKKNNNFELFDFKELERLELISLKSLEYVFKNLDVLLDDNILKDAQNVVEQIGFKRSSYFEGSRNFIKHFIYTSAESIGYYDRTYNYALTSYLITFQNDFDIELFKQWCRILQNLIYNQAYIQGKDEFENAIRHIDVLLSFGADIEKTLINNIEELNVFPRQIQEEVLKVKLYKRDADLYNMFVELENHPYFNGQIDFIIKMAAFGSKEIDKFNKSIFVNLSQKLVFLFDPKFMGKNEWLLQRALMTKGFEFKPRTSNRREIFSNNASDLRLKEEGWRWLFKNDAAQDYLEIFKQLLYNLTNNNIENDLLNLIDSYDVKDWKYYFIKEPHTIRSCKKRMMKWNGENEIRLLNNPTANGFHSELRSKFLQYNLSIQLNPFKNINYWQVKDQQEWPCCFLYGWDINDRCYHIDIRFRNGNYEIKFLNVEEVQALKIEQNIISILTQLHYQDDDNNGYVYLVKKEDYNSLEEALKIKLEQTLGELKNIA